MHDVVNWIDSEALLLIFSMMTIVSVLMETGIFDYIAVYTFQVRFQWHSHRQYKTTAFIFGFISVEQGEYLEIDWDIVFGQCNDFDVSGQCRHHSPVHTHHRQIVRMSASESGANFAISHFECEHCRTDDTHRTSAEFIDCGRSICGAAKCYISDVCDAYVRWSGHCFGRHEYLFAHSLSQYQRDTEDQKCRQYGHIEHLA